jgi:RHS repeat-associated protein
MSEQLSPRRHPIIWIATFILLCLAISPAFTQITSSLDSKVKVAFGGYVLNRTTGTFDTRVTLMNISLDTLQAPISLVITGISNPSVTLANSAGVTADGKPYLVVPVPAGGFVSGTSITTLTLKFKNTSPAVAFTFTSSIIGTLPPIADAGKNLSGVTGKLINLDGSASRDPQGKLLTYAWRVIQAPVNSKANLVSPTTPNPAFTPDLAGTYQFELVVSNGTLSSQPARVILTASSINSPPVARAGNPQNGKVGVAVTLDGSASNDPEGAPLIPQWSFSSVPVGSALTDESIASRNLLKANFVPDKPGLYVLTLTVSDGALSSTDTTQANVVPPNVPPNTNAGTDIVVNLGATVNLNGTGTSDPDAGPGPLTFAWTFVTKPVGSTLTSASIVGQNTPSASFTPDKAGTYQLKLTASDGEAFVEDTVLATVNSPPKAVDDAVTTNKNTALDISVLANDSDADADPLKVTTATQPTNGSVTINPNNSVKYTPKTDFTGIDSFNYTISDGKGGTASAKVNVTITTVQPNNLAPKVTVSAISPILPTEQTVLSATVVDDGLPNPPATVTTVWTKVSGPGTVTFVKASAAVTAASFSASGTYVLRLSASDGSLTSIADAIVVVTPTEASAVPHGVTTTIDDATAFIYVGPNASQTGVPANTIESKRAALLRGKIMTNSGAALPGVKVTVLNHSEFGQTLSRNDGYFNMVVNAGGALVLKFEKPGFLPVQRTVSARWNEWAVLPDVVLIQPDPKVTKVNLATPGMKAASGSVVSDKDGARQVTLLFPDGVKASIFKSDGSLQPVSSLSFRSTEYTVGASGPQSMPGNLPAASAYTYAVEMGADEASINGKKIAGRDVVFSRPVISYVTNFLKFPIGISVPTGYYDNDKGQWVAIDSGRVIKILSIAGGLANLDIDGSGTAALTDALAILGISTDERLQLGKLYTAGITLSRVALPHFSTYDMNYGWEVSGQAPNLPNPTRNPHADPDCLAGSIIECENQVLREGIPISGTSFSLNYRSDRAKGHIESSTITIPVSLGRVPANLDRIELVISIGGQQTIVRFPPKPNQQHTFTWDGKDAFGRRLEGKQECFIRVGYVYKARYVEISRFGGAVRAGGSGGGGGGGGGAVPPGLLASNPTRDEITYWQEFLIPLGSTNAGPMGGWTVTPHHTYEPGEGNLYQGNGDFRGKTPGSGTSTGLLAGGGSTIGGENVAAAAVKLAHYSGGVNAARIAAAPDGSFYMTQPGVPFASGFAVIRKVGRDGRISTFMGAPTSGPCVSVPVSPVGVSCGDGIPASQARLATDSSIAVGPDGSLYISERWANRIRRVTPDGIVHHIAGTGEGGFSGDFGPATLARVNFPGDIAVSKDGTVFFADMVNSRLRTIDTSGIITSLVIQSPGAGRCRVEPDAPAPPIISNHRHHTIAIDPDDGSIYTDLDDCIVRVDQTGKILANVTGSTLNTTLVQQVHATSKGLYLLHASGSGRGLGLVLFNKDGGASIPIFRHAGLTQFFDPFPDDDIVDFGLAPDGSFLLLGTGSINARDARSFVVRLGTGFASSNGSNLLVPSNGGAEIYEFDRDGRHLATRHPLTGAALMTFGYDVLGFLNSTTDGNGNVTKFERDGAGNLTAIVAPFGQRTTISVDGFGNISQVRNPAGETVTLAHSADGLLNSMTDPKGQVHRYFYDAAGRLIRDENPAGGVKTLTRTQTGTSLSVTVETALGRKTKHEIENVVNGDQKRTTTSPAGHKTTTEIRANSTRITTTPDGTISETALEADPRWGLLVPTGSTSIKLPSGLTSKSTSTRTISLSKPADLLSVASMAESIDINGRTYTKTYDGATGTLILTSPEGRKIVAVIDALGRPLSIQMGSLFPVKYEYDLRGRPKKIAQGTGLDERIVSFEYDIAGFLAKITDPLGRAVTFTYDNVGRIKTQKRPDGNLIAYDYDTNGNLKSLIPPGRPAHTFAYNGVDQLGAYIPPPAPDTGALATVYGYDRDQQLLSLLRPDGKAIAHGYDAFGRLSTLTIPTGLVTYGYDTASSRLTSIDSPGAVRLSYAYDGTLLKDTHWSGPVIGTVRRTYDNDFRVASLAVSGGAVTAYQYDRDNLVVKEGGLTITRDPVTGYVSATALGIVTDNYTYDGFGDVKSYTARSGSTITLGFVYVRDKLGRITKKTETILGAVTTFEYKYDVVGQLDTILTNGAVSARYTYDANGNRQTESISSQIIPATYDNQDRQTSVDGQVFVYTANGELKTVGRDTARATYEFDVFGSLTNVNSPSGANVRYGVDGQHRRTVKYRDSLRLNSFLYDGKLRPVAELTPTNTIFAQYIYGLRANVPEYFVKGSISYRILGDHLGSPRIVVNAASGSILQRMDFSAWGRVEADTNRGFQPFGFAGGIYDPDSQLVRFGARDYDPLRGRWTQKDPISFGGKGTNLYAYAGNSPVQFKDALGLFETFGFVGGTLESPGPIRLAAEGVLIAGVNDGHPFTASINAVGIEVGGQQNYVASFVGVEVTSDGRVERIQLHEVDFGAELPFLAGLGISIGFFDTPSDYGFYFSLSGGIIGSHGFLGFGFGWDHDESCAKP